MTSPRPRCAPICSNIDSRLRAVAGPVALDGGALVVDGRRIALHRAADLSVLDLSGVDLVMECTGRADGPEVAGRGLAAGAGRVLVSGPSRGGGGDGGAGGE